MRWRAVVVGVAVVVGIAWVAHARVVERSDQPVHVVADRLEVDNKNHVARFIGSVRATQGDVTITSDRLEVYYEPEGGGGVRGISDGGGKVRKVVAIGHVKIVQRDRVAVGRRATYWAGARKILLEGNATVWRGRNQISGEKITVFLDQDRAVVHGRPGKRVSVTIAPRRGKRGK